jgi:hypothetical protein
MMLATRSFCSTGLLRRVCFFGSRGRKVGCFVVISRRSFGMGCGPTTELFHWKPHFTLLPTHCNHQAPKKIPSYCVHLIVTGSELIHDTD